MDAVLFWFLGMSTVKQGWGGHQKMGEGYNKS